MGKVVAAPNSSIAAAGPAGAQGRDTAALRIGPAGSECGNNSHQGNKANEEYSAKLSFASDDA